MTRDEAFIIPEEDLPFIQVKLQREDENLENIRTMHAWAVDVPNPRQISDLLQWLEKYSLDDPDLGHLKRIRKRDTQTSLLLSATVFPPSLPPELNLSEPFAVEIPVSAARSPEELAAKSQMWPTFYAPSRKDEMEPWSKAKVEWALSAVKVLLQETKLAISQGNLPITAHVPLPFGEVSSPVPIAGVVHDTRQSFSHPLRHAVPNLIKHLVHLQLTTQTSPPSDSTPNPTNGTNYLLTSRSVFLTYEPCIMCSMSLLHSRVKEVFFLLPMQQTGGCGGVTCLPALEGVNHRFTIWKWSGTASESMDITFGDISIDEKVDA